MMSHNRLLPMLFVSYLLCACALVPKQQPHPHPLKDTLLQRLDQIRATFTSVKGLAKGTYSYGEDSASASQVVIARSPKALRLETLGPFGSPLMMLASDGEALTVLLPGETRAFQGSADSGFLQRVLRLPLQQADLVSLLLYSPLNLPWATATVAYEDKGMSRLSLESPYGLSQVYLFDRDLQLVQCQYLLAGIRQLQVDYDDFDDKRQGYPQRIELTLPQDGVEVRLKFSSVEVNTEVPDQKFALIPPAGYHVEPFPVD